MCAAATHNPFSVSREETNKTVNKPRGFRSKSRPDICTEGRQFLAVSQGSARPVLCPVDNATLVLASLHLLLLKKKTNKNKTKTAASLLATEKFNSIEQNNAARPENSSPNATNDRDSSSEGRETTHSTKESDKVPPRLRCVTRAQTRPAMKELKKQEDVASHLKNSFRLFHSCSRCLEKKGQHGVLNNYC